MFENVERIWKKAICEMIIDQIGRNRQKMRIVRMLDAVTLKRAEIIGITELGAQIFKNLPVPGTPPEPDFFFQKCAQIRCHAVVVEQSVIDIKKKNRLVH